MEMVTRILNLPNLTIFLESLDKHDDKHKIWASVK